MTWRILISAVLMMFHLQMDIDGHNLDFDFKLGFLYIPVALALLVVILFS